MKPVALMLCLTAVVGTAAVVVPPPGPRALREFDPDRIADLEVEMWQAYYRKEKLHLFRLLVVMLREQYRYSWAKALGAGFHLARAAATFGDATSDYDRVLPDLESAYETAREWMAADFDAKAVARGELAWWVARRIPAERSPENVGRLIGEMYAAYYGVPLERVREAGVLRARAGALRDAGGVNADWAQVRGLLRASFGALYRGVH